MYLKSLSLLLMIWVCAGAGAAEISDKSQSFGVWHSKISPQVLDKMRGHSSVTSTTLSEERLASKGWSVPKGQAQNRELRVYIEAKSLDDELIQLLEAAGVEIEVINEALAVIQGKIPLDKILDVVEHPKSSTIFDFPITAILIHKALSAQRVISAWERKLLVGHFLSMAVAFGWE